MSEDWGTPPPQQQDWGAPPPHTAAPVTTVASPAVTPPSQEQYLANDSVPSFSFDGPIGTAVDGLVVSAEVQQQIDFYTKEPAFWKNGEPKWTLRVHLQTGTIDPARAEDDGVRSVFYDYKKRDSLDAAFKEAGVRPVVEVGARIRTEYVAGGTGRPGDTLYKTYSTKYAPPGSPAAEALAKQLAAGGTPAASAAPPTPPPAPAQAQSWGGGDEAPF